MKSAAKLKSRFIEARSLFENCQGLRLEPNISRCLVRKGVALSLVQRSLHTHVDAAFEASRKACAHLSSHDRKALLRPLSSPNHTQQFEHPIAMFEL
eukprot:6095621-Pleurochrysis_carterae.AAC.3